jgi:HSP20 family molecular chaperone IbpA
MVIMDHAGEDAETSTPLIINTIIIIDHKMPLTWSVKFSVRPFTPTQIHCFANFPVNASGPHYSIEEMEDLIELSMEGPGVAAKDLTVEVVDSTVFRIWGSQSIQESVSYKQSEFDQSFQLDDTDMDVDNIQVTLSNGILKIVAPKKLAKVTSKRIPITIQEVEESEQLLTSENRI